MYGKTERASNFSSPGESFQCLKQVEKLISRVSTGRCVCWRGAYFGQNDQKLQKNIKFNIWGKIVFRGGEEKVA